MTQLIRATVSLLMFCLLTSCGGSNDTGDVKPPAKKSSATEVTTEKPFRVGMNWLVKTGGPFVSYEKFEVKNLEDSKVTLWVTTLNKNKEPFGGDAGHELVLPVLKIKDLSPGNTEELKAAGRTFVCRKIESPEAGATNWRSLEYPLISVRFKMADTDKELVEFNEGPE